MKNFLKAPVELPFTRYEVWELIFGVAFWFTVCIILNACSNSDPVFADSTSASSCEEADTLSTTADSVFTYIFFDEVRTSGYRYGTMHRGVWELQQPSIFTRSQLYRYASSGSKTNSSFGDVV